MILPEVYCPGFPRCGTTWIARVLAQHPELHIPLKAHPVYPYPVKKEIHYLNRKVESLVNIYGENLRYDQNINYYLDFWKEGKINIDFSICSAYDPNCAESVKKVLGDVKILFFVRNKKDHKLSIKVLEKIKYQIPELSNFEGWIKNFQETFSNVKIINLEDTKKNPQKILREILEYIGADDKDFNFNLDLEKHSSRDLVTHRRSR